MIQSADTHLTALAYMLFFDVSYLDAFYCAEYPRFFVVETIYIIYIHKGQLTCTLTNLTRLTR